MTVRAGRGWAKEASTEAKRAITVKCSGDMIFLRFFPEFLSLLRGQNPLKYSPVVSRTWLIF